jgi:hypothetical protein
MTVTTGSGGDIGFAFQVAGLGIGQALTATATNLATGGTSEFSLNRTITPGP